jgi:hypothetical protein
MMCRTKACPCRTLLDVSHPVSSQTGSSPKIPQCCGFLRCTHRLTTSSQSSEEKNHPPRPTRKMQHVNSGEGGNTSVHQTKGSPPEEHATLKRSRRRTASSYGRCINYDLCGHMILPPHSNRLESCMFCVELFGEGVALHMEKKSRRLSSQLAASQTHDPSERLLVS